MRRIAYSALFSAIALLGSNSVKADITVTAGTEINRSSSGSINSSGGGTVHTFSSDFSCSSNTINSGNENHGASENRACINELVQKHKNLGKSLSATAAMNTAMSTLPESSPDFKYTCGVGTGGNSGTYAVSTGCAVNISDRFSFNTGASLALQDSKDYGGGTIDNFGVKAGFLYKFGGPIKSTSISRKENKDLKAEVQILKSTNEKLQELIAIQDKRLSMQNRRLESLEKIALDETNSKELASKL